MKHEVKTYDAQFKATRQGDKGVVEALVSVFGNVDMGGDRVMPGAFAKTLDNWQTKGDPIPFIFSHQWDDPDAYLGGVTSAEETPDGLVVKAQIDLNHPPAARVFELMKKRLVTQFSFGYFATDAETIDDPEYGPVRELRSVDLFEVGPTLLGMNPATQLLEAASALSGAKAGRVLSSKNEKALRDARDLLDGVLAAVETIDPQTESASGKSADGLCGGECGDVCTCGAAEPIEAVALEEAPAHAPEEGAHDEGADGSEKAAVGDAAVNISAEQVVRLLAKTRQGEE